MPMAFSAAATPSPTSFALVVALHAAGFGALILAGSTQFIQQERERTIVRPIPIPPDPPPIPPPDRVEPERPAQHQTTQTTTPPLVPANDDVVNPGRSDPRRPAPTARGPRPV